MMRGQYLSYHNPDSMGTEFREIALSGCIATDKEKIAERAAEEGGVIWCVGKRGRGKKARYFLYQRIIDTKCSYTPSEFTREGDFKILLCGKTTMPINFEMDITEEAYMFEIKKILGFGLQPLGTKHKPALEHFIELYERKNHE